MESTFVPGGPFALMSRTFWWQSSSLVKSVISGHFSAASSSHSFFNLQRRYFDHLHSMNTHRALDHRDMCQWWLLSYDDCLENKGRLQDCSCSIGSYHCILCYAHILWAAPTGQTDLSLSHWVHFTVLRCICVLFSLVFHCMHVVLL